MLRTKGMVQKAAIINEHSHEKEATIQEVSEYPINIPITEQEVNTAIHTDFYLSLPKASAHSGT